MNTKKCKKCGWVFPPTYERASCRFCGTNFEEGICSSCGTFGKLFPGRTLCRDCHNKYRRESGQNNAIYAKSIKKYIKSLEDTYDEWLARIKSIPKPYVFLTETQWLEVCRFFNGCALCDNKEVTTRGFFIPFKEGGKYCNWNVIPLCEQCATRCNVQPNPFKRIDARMNKTVNIERGMTKQKLEVVVQYLGSKMEVLINEPKKDTGV